MIDAINEWEMKLYGWFTTGLVLYAVQTVSGCTFEINGK